MSRGRIGPSLFQMPAWLLALAEREPQTLDVEAANSRLHRAGVTEMEAREGEQHPHALNVRGPALDVVVDVMWDESNAPVSAALAELVDFLEHYGPLIQLHVGSTDMELVADAARELARYRHVIGGDEEPVHSPYTLIEGVLETGLIVMYARSFTGRARLGDRWLPKEAADRVLHMKIMDERQLHAHADWTGARTLVDTNKMLGIDGPPILAETRSQLSKQQLLDIADLAARQSSRFMEAAGELKMRLGVSNAPWPHDPPSDG